MTNAYTQAMWRWLQAGAHYGLVREYEGTVTSDRNKLRRGEMIGTAALYRWWTAEYIRVQRRLQAYRGTDVRPTAHEVSLEISVIGWTSYWLPLDGYDAFWAEVAKVDGRIDAAGFNDCLSRAFTWAFEREYFDAAALEAWEAIKANGLRSWPPPRRSSARSGFPASTPDTARGGAAAGLPRAPHHP